MKQVHSILTPSSVATSRTTASNDSRPSCCAVWETVPPVVTASRDTF
jgi:hypothetical protein